MQEIKGFGVGTDIEDIDRFKNLDRNEDSIFLNKIFTKKELDYSFSKAKPFQHLAVRYSGKEAIVKALNSLGKSNINYKDIEILNNDNGVPKVNLYNYGNLKVNISLSHSNDKALAFAVVIKE
jgi:holo-[acyl-carrier protein] synthase